MRLIVLVVMAAMLLCCVVAVGVVTYMVLKVPDLTEDVFVTEMTNDLHSSASAIIRTAPDGSRTIQFREVDLVVFGFSPQGQATPGVHATPTTSAPISFIGTPFASWIFGSQLRIDEERISLVSGDIVMFSAVPEIVDGALVLTDVETHENPLSFLFDAEDFKEVIETGFARAFADHDLTPTALTLHDGVMAVEVTPASSRVSQWTFPLEIAARGIPTTQLTAPGRPRCPRFDRGSSGSPDARASRGSRRG